METIENSNTKSDNSSVLDTKNSLRLTLNGTISSIANGSLAFLESDAATLVGSQLSDITSIEEDKIISILINTAKGAITTSEIAFNINGNIKRGHAIFSPYTESSLEPAVEMFIIESTNK